MVGNSIIAFPAERLHYLALLKVEGAELRSLYFRAKSESMKVRLFHFKSPPTITDTNWSRKWYYESLRWELGQNKIQQHKKKYPENNSVSLPIAVTLDQGHLAASADVMGSHY